MSDPAQNTPPATSPATNSGQVSQATVSVPQNQPIEPVAGIDSPKSSTGDGSISPTPLVAISGTDDASPATPSSGDAAKSDGATPAPVSIDDGQLDAIAQQLEQQAASLVDGSASSETGDTTDTGAEASAETATSSTPANPDATPVATPPVDSTAGVNASSATSPQVTEIQPIEVAKTADAGSASTTENPASTMDTPTDAPPSIEPVTPLAGSNSSDGNAPPADPSTAMTPPETGAAEPSSGEKPDASAQPTTDTTQNPESTDTSGEAGAVSSTTPQSETPAENQPAFPASEVPEPEVSAEAPTQTSQVEIDTDSLLGVLTSKHYIKKEQAEQLELEHLNNGKNIEAMLIERKWVDEEVLTQAKAELNHIPFVKISDKGISPQALTMLPEGVARRYRMFPFSVDTATRKLSVAMVDPLNLAAIDFAQQKTGFTIDAFYAAPSEVDKTIAEKYAQNLSSEVTEALEETSQVGQNKKDQANFSQLSSEVVRQAPIAKIVETILSFALKSRASDVHIEPQETRTRIRYRIDGILSERLVLPKTVHEAVVSRIKILSKLKIDEKRIPQDGRFNYVGNEGEVDLRVSTLPTVYGEKIVMRLLKKNETVPSLEQLGLSGLALRRIEDSIKVPHGIILVTGPTGSGKTTTLYSVLHILNTTKVNIMTLEDPVEYQMAGVNQVQTNSQAGLTFASGLRSFLRQDPNIIMVGEIRDTETAELAVQASLTGHLVFSTLHTSSAAGALPRLIDMKAEPFLLASSMTLTMAQRIARKINSDFKEEYTPEPEVVEDIKQVLGPHFESWCKQNNKDPNNVVLYRTKKDRPDTEPEYKGRVGIFEVMRITDEIRTMIVQEKSSDEIEKKAVEDGMLLMKQDGYLKALAGVTTLEEVLRVAQI